MTLRQRDLFSVMRTLVPGVLLAALLPVSAFAGNPESCEFRVVQWNAAGLDPTHGNNNQPIKIANTVIGYATQIDANVITLQEIELDTITHLEATLPGWHCGYYQRPDGTDYLAVCVDGMPTNLNAQDLTADPEKECPPVNHPWWSYVQVEYQGVPITSVHTRSCWRDHQINELHTNVPSGVVAGDFNHIDAADFADPPWFQTDLDGECTFGGDYRGMAGDCDDVEPMGAVKTKWKIDHVLSVEEPQTVWGDAVTDWNGSNHKVVLAEITYPPAGPSLAATITNTTQPIEVDGTCAATVDFQIDIHDNCCLDPDDLDLDVTAHNPTANATLGAVSIDSVVASGPRDVEVTGHVAVSALQSCPAEVVIAAAAQDCAGNANDTAAQGTSASVLVLDATAPEVAPNDSDLYCLWPPTHHYACFDAGQFHPVITDNCQTNPTWTFAACTSDEPDDGTGDGSTADDCMIDVGDQGFCARAERMATSAAGRRYNLAAQAMDACGNASASTEIGNVYVPRDENPALTCIAPPAP